jgi:hypothetical protein
MIVHLLQGVYFQIYLHFKAENFITATCAFRATFVNFCVFQTWSSLIIK